MQKVFNYQPSTIHHQLIYMIQVTRLNGQAFVVNADKIRYVEQTPDTMICCDTGEKLMVKESMQEVIRRSIDYARAVRRPITD
ncbi:MAG: flagellar FlbD family protein [Tepidisphaeraceae bacterium]